ncbi:PilZ domain-containing protein [Asticcacaulis machinosus]|uniref:PilZ domain-containing protein n=1 Tax=Asticcacaulis machinosus TaxID=2984211 RepID=A0ABT5HL71_9CAUL|nr:PilZ domain-containing protein [Asticcacaulis machinosus]MDC7677000.1 PilZ domain-containing protein [Asticcacaulis machinosus]
MATPSAPVSSPPHSTPLATPPAASSKVEIIQPYEMFANRRNEPRFECNDRGCLLFLNSQQTIHCTILDQSASGAQVLFDSIGEIPSEVWLIDLDAHVVRRGRSVWTMAHKMGLKFDFIEKLTPGKMSSPKVPRAVYDAWQTLNQPPPPKDEDTFFLD